MHDRGWMQGLIMMANPVGFVLGGLLIGRLVAPATRQRLIRPFALVAPLVLVLALAAPPVYVVALISAGCGFATAALIPATNGLFVQPLPNAFRARAFGVMQSGVMLLQGAAVLVTGALADRFSLPTVVGVWGLAGIPLMLAMIVSWPRAQRMAEAIEATRMANAAGKHRPTVTNPDGQRSCPGGRAAGTTNHG